MGIENCIYIDTEGKWWIAKTESPLSTEKIILIEEKTEKLKKLVSKDIIEKLNIATPYILYVSNAKWYFVDATNRETHHK